VLNCTLRGSTTTERKTRIERFRKQLTYDEAFTYLTQFYSRSTCTNEHLDSDDTSPDAATANGSNGKALATITGFPRPVVVALAHAIKYLSTFSIEHSLLQTRFFSKFSERTHMLLNANTLVNL
jgi:DNA mismatch repair protein MSH3